MEREQRVGMQLTNSLISSASYYLNLDNSDAYINDEFSYGIPEIDRYYGYMDNVTVTDGTESVSIEMERVSFGLHIAVSGIEAGYLRIEAAGSIESGGQQWLQLQGRVHLPR